jgi:regulatory protein
MERRLLAARFEADEVQDVLTRLERVGLIDDEAFARQYAEHRFGARKEGSRAVAQGLRAAGIAPALAEMAAEGAPDEDEERAAELARSRATRLAGVAPEKAFARLSSLLMRRGYGPQIARSAARKALEIPFHED